MPTFEIVNNYKKKNNNTHCKRVENCERIDL